MLKEFDLVLSNVLLLVSSSKQITLFHCLLICSSTRKVSKYTQIPIRDIGYLHTREIFAKEFIATTTWSQCLTKVVHTPRSALAQILQACRSCKHKVPLFYHFESLTYTLVNLLDLENLLQSLT